MLNVSRFLLRGLSNPTTSFKSFNQVRFNSSKQMLEEPGIGRCCAGIKPSEACGSLPPPKPRGPGHKINPDCFDDPCCPYPHTSYDEHFKHLLQHKKRTIFQQTWVECPPRRLVQKVVCGEPEPEPTCGKLERPKPEPTDLGCFTTDKRCPKIRMPGCRPVEIRKFCKQLPRPMNCEKIKCPYPSFSECQRSLPKPLRQTECACFPVPCVCEILQFLKAKNRLRVVKK